MYYCELYIRNRWLSMVEAMEHSVATQRAIALLLLRLPNIRLGGPENTTVRGFCCCANVLIANDKMLIKIYYKLNYL